MNPGDLQTCLSTLHRCSPPQSNRHAEPHTPHRQHWRRHHRRRHVGLMPMGACWLHALGAAGSCCWCVFVFCAVCVLCQLIFAVHRSLPVPPSCTSYTYQLFHAVSGCNVVLGSICLLAAARLSPACTLVGMELIMGSAVVYCSCICPSTRYPAAETCQSAWLDGIGNMWAPGSDFGPPVPALCV